MGGSSLGPGWSSLPAPIVTSTICGCVSSLIPRVWDHRFARGWWATSDGPGGDGESLACAGSLESVTAQDGGSDKCGGGSRRVGIDCRLESWVSFYSHARSGEATE
jgi:hypothetical protein